MVSATPSPSSTPSAGCTLGWSLVPSPNGGADGNELYDVDIVAADDIWAVGTYLSESSGTQQTLVLHWDGIQWTQVPSPTIGVRGSTLRGVAALSADDVWVAGSYSDLNGTHPLLLHWDGTSWSQSSVGMSGALNALTAVSTNDIWAVGGSSLNVLIIHWDGTAWTQFPSSQTGRLYAVDAVSGNDIWAVGSDQGTTTQTLTMHWNGSTWSRLPSPNVGNDDNELLAVSAASSGDVWAVGIYYELNYHRHTLTMHWNGTQWVHVASPNPGEDSFLLGVAALSVTDTWAVGFSFTETNGAALTLHWDGAVWTQVPSPSPGNISLLWDVEAMSHDDLWAVGRTDYYPSPNHTLIERYTSTCPTPSPTAVTTATLTPSASPTPGCTPSQDYTYVVSTGATIVPGTSRVPGSVCDGCTTAISLPFPYYFYDGIYYRVIASNKGNLQFNSNNPAEANTCLPNPSVNDTIFAYWDDHNTNINDAMGIFTSTTGTAPNRIFNIEWRGGYVANDVRSRFQVRLYEGQYKFEVIYGQTRGGYSATIGVQKGGDPQRFTQYSCDLSGRIQPGLKLTFDWQVCEGNAARRKP